MSDLPPGFVLDSAQGPGPVYGPAPVIKPPAPPSEAEMARVDIARQNAELQRQKFEYQQQRDAAKSGQGGQSDDPKVQAKLANLDALTGQINRVQELYDANLKDEAIPLLGSLMEYLPTPTNRQFDSAAAGMAEQGLAAFRVPGVGAQSDTELRQFVDANKPSASDADLSIEEKLRQLRARVDATRQQMGLPAAEWRNGQPQQDDYAPKVLSAAPTQMEAATDFRETMDPEMSARVDRLIRSGAPLPAINAMLRQRGASEVPQEAYDTWRAFLAENPDYEGSTAEAIRREPLSMIEQGITNIGSGAAGAYALGAGQFLSGNTLDNLAPDSEQARLALSVSQAQNPGYFGAGEFTGGMLAGLTGEAGLARLGMASGIVRGAAADGLAGAANGAGMADNGNRLTGALGGAVAQGGGSLAGGAVMRGAGMAMNPSGGSLSDLYAAGVRPTLGQRVSNAGDGRGFKGMVGGAINATEEALQSIPIVGSAIRGARQEARDQFQVGAFNEALREVGETLPGGMRAGTEPHVYAKQVFDRVYDQARSGMVMVADEELANDLSGLAQTVGALTDDSQRRFTKIYRNIVERRAQDGQLGGEAYKKAQSELGKVIASIGNSKTGDDELASALTDLSHALDGAARRHSDPEAVKLLDAADRGYAKYVRLKEAGKRRGGGAGEFTPTQLDAAVQRESSGPRSEQYLRGEALMQDYAKQGMSLADKLPNSGTADRVMAGYAVGSTAAGASIYANPMFAGLYGAIGTAYAPGVRKVTTGALAPSKGKRKAISHALKKIERLSAGATGALALQGTAPGQ